MKEIFFTERIVYISVIKNVLEIWAFIICREILKIAEFLGNGLKEKLLKDDKKMLKEITVKADIKTIKKDKALVFYSLLFLSNLFSI